MSSKRVLFVIDNLGWGGAQRQLANLAAGLAGRGHDVEVFLYEPGYDHVAGLVRDAGVRIVEVEKRTKIDFGVARQLIRSVRAHASDVLIGFLPTPGVYASLAGRATGVPVVVSERSFFEARIGALDRLLRQSHRLVSHVTTNSHHTRERMELEFPWLRGRISTIWNGIDTQAYRPRQTGDRPAPGPVPSVLGVGSIVPGKEIERLAEALVLSHEAGGVPFEVHWAGRGREAEGSEAIIERVDSLVANAGVQEHWHWLGLRDDIAELHGQHDAVVHPSFLEGLPNAVCEALASGRPVIASRAGDHPRLIGNDERGFLFEPGDAASLAAAIGRLGSMDAPGREAIEQRCREFAERELSLHAYVDGYEDLLERVTSART